MNIDKRQVAELYLRLNDYHKVALHLFPGQYGLACKLADQWTLDPEIEQFKNEFIDSNGRPMPVSDAELANEVLQLARSIPFYDDKIKAYALAAKIMGYEKTTSKTDLNVTPTVPFVVTLSEMDANL